MEYFLIGLVGFILGWFICRQIWHQKLLSANTSMNSVIKRLDKNIDVERMHYLECLRREFANQIMGIDTEAMHKAFHKMHQYEENIYKIPEENVKADFTALGMKYPTSEDFDLIGTIHYIEYEEAFSQQCLDDIIDLYNDISRFMILLNILKIKENRIFNDKELRQLDKEIQRRKDKKFKTRIVEAINNYYIFLDGADSLEKDAFRNEYTYRATQVRRVHMTNSPEIGYGIYFSDTNEYGFYTVFIDDTSNRIYETYYRSDAKYKNLRVISFV